MLPEHLCRAVIVRWRGRVLLKRIKAEPSQAGCGRKNDECYLMLVSSCSNDWHPRSNCASFANQKGQANGCDPADFCFISLLVLFSDFQFKSTVSIGKGLDRKSGIRNRNNGFRSSDRNRFFGIVGIQMAEKRLEFAFWQPEICVRTMHSNLFVRFGRNSV